MRTVDLIRGRRPGRRRGLSLALAAAAAVAVAAAAVGLGVLARQLLPAAHSGTPRLSRMQIANAPVVHTRHGMDGQATWASGSYPAPPINTLRDQHGQRFSLASLRGHTVAIVFFDSLCRQECPLEGRALAAAESKLPRDRRPVLVAVSVDPKDTPATVAHALREWRLAHEAPWYWLMGTKAQLSPVWDEYHIQVTPPIDGDIEHTEALYLVARNGDVRSAYLWPFGDRYVTHDLRVLSAA